MLARSLPLRPDLGQLKLQARELHRDHGARKLSVAARIAANHPRSKGQPLQAILDRPLALADAQVVLAREYGFQGWAQLKARVDQGQRIAELRPHPHFDQALRALLDGESERLRALIAAVPDLVRARTNLEPPYGYFSGATLLHHVAGNPSWDRPLPATIIGIARTLLEHGADVDASTLGPNGGTTMGLVITSAQASDANISGPLIDLLLAHGAKLDWRRQDVLDLPLANHAPRAAEKLIELGAIADVCAAAALGRLDLLRECFDADGRLRARPRRRGKVMRQRDAIGLAMLFAYVNQHADAVDFLLEMDGNWDMTGVNNGTALHRAAGGGDLPMVRRLVTKGADTTNRDNPFTATPLSWADHGKQREVVDWMRTHCADHRSARCGLLQHERASRGSSSRRSRICQQARRPVGYSGGHGPALGSSPDQ